MSPNQDIVKNLSTVDLYWPQGDQEEWWLTQNPFALSKGLFSTITPPVTLKYSGECVFPKE
jgi:hypothetical protein